MKRNLWRIGTGALLAALPAWAEGPWWDDYPLILQGDPSRMSEYHATISFNDMLNSPSWGTYPVALAKASDVAELHARGFKSITYYETFGQSCCYIGELAPEGGSPTPTRAIYWKWENYAGGPIHWIGAHNYFDDEEFARPYTRTHPVYGAPPMTYPDGTIATGHIGDPSDPRNSRIFDAGASKNILGQIDYSPSEVGEDVQAKGPHDGLLQIDGRYVGAIWVSKDSACPAWTGMDAATARLAASRGLDGMWSDNFSAWDSFSMTPLNAAFGEWSVSLFRDYLRKHFTEEERATMGATDLPTFDVRTALRAQTKAWGGNDTDLRAPAWRDARWLEHPLWRAYLVFKRRTGTEALTRYLTEVKRAAREAGVEEFLIAGNDIPSFSLGWVRGELDMVSTETSLDWSLDGGPRGFMPPPAGRMAPHYKLSREHGRSRFVNVWMYLNQQYEPYRLKPGFAKALHYEMLATHALPLAYPAFPTVAGTPESTAEVFGFVGSVKETYGLRVPVEDVGILYSPSSVLAFMTPGGMLDHGRQVHQFGYYGWATALQELHYQYRPIVEWKLTPEALSGLRVLIVPNAWIVEPEALAVLTPWVENGGRLIVTGDSGLRLGESHHFERNPAGLSLAPLTGVSSADGAPARQAQARGQGKVVYLSGNLGLDYYVDEARRETLRPELAGVMSEALDGSGPTLVTAPGVPSTVSLTMYRDAAARRQFVDAVNHDLEVEEDRMNAQGTFGFEAALPEWLDVPELRAFGVSPDGKVDVSVTRRAPGRATVSVGSLGYYAAVVFEAGDVSKPGPMP